MFRDSFIGGGHKKLNDVAEGVQGTSWHARGRGFKSHVSQATQ